MTKKKKRGKGAPKGNQNARKKEPKQHYSGRATEEQISSWIDAADRDGFATLSEWMRWACDQVAGR